MTHLTHILKRISLSALILSLVVVNIPVDSVAASQPIAIVIDGEPVVFDQDSGYPFIDSNDRTLVPFRRVLESFGADVAWDADNRIAMASLGDTKVKVPIGRNLLYTQDETYIIDAPAVIVDNRTYLPIRAVVESFGAGVGWDSDQQAVTVTRDGLLKPTYKEMKAYGLGMGEDTVVARHGKPDLVLASTFGFDWWIYRNDYRDYIQFGVGGGMVQSVYVASSRGDWPYEVSVGMTSDSVGSLYEKSRFVLKSDTVGEYFVMPYYDEHDGMTVDGVMVLEKDLLYATTPRGEATEELVAAYEQQILELTNVFRVEQGEEALDCNDKLADVARSHSEDMAVRDYFSHTTPEGLSPYERMKNEGISYHMAGENIAAGQRYPIEVVNGWINSMGHRNNMLNDYEELGVGVYFADAGDKYGVYYTQNFRTE